MKKDFKYTIKTKSGLILAQSIVSFGSKKYPFPEDWKNSGIALMALMEHEQTFLKENFNIFFEESSKLDDWPTYVAIEEAAEKEYPSKMIVFPEYDKNNEILRKAFCNGAKSESAKQYWFEIFKQQKE